MMSFTPLDSANMLVLMESSTWNSVSWLDCTEWDSPAGRVWSEYWFHFQQDCCGSHPFTGVGRALQFWEPFSDYQMKLSLWQKQGLESPRKAFCISLCLKYQDMKKVDKDHPEVLMWSETVPELLVKAGKLLLKRAQLLGGWRAPQNTKFLEKVLTCFWRLYHRNTCINTMRKEQLGMYINLFIKEKCQYSFCQREIVSQIYCSLLRKSLICGEVRSAGMQYLGFSKSLL